MMISKIPVITSKIEKKILNKQTRVRRKTLICSDFLIFINESNMVKRPKPELIQQLHAKKKSVLNPQNKPGVS